MRIVDSIDRVTWSSFVQQHPSGSVFHTPEMFDVFQRASGYRPLVLAALDREDNVLALLLSVRVQTLPSILGHVSSRALLYAEPLLRKGDEGSAALNALIAEHDRRMRRSVLFTEVRPLSGDDGQRAALTAQGYQHYAYLNYVSDVSRPPEELLHKMSKRGRRDLRKGQRQGLCAEDATNLEGIDALYALLQETYANVRVPLAGRDLFVNALQILSPVKMLKIFVVKHEGTPIAGTALLLHQNTSFFWYAGLRRGCGLSAMEVIVFAMLEWAHMNGYKTFDFGGAGEPEKEYGVRDFKAKFGGDLVKYGRSRKIYSPWAFALATWAYEASRRVWSGSDLSKADKDAPERLASLQPHC
jgi:serine/alanine adding enzyme